MFRPVVLAPQPAGAAAQGGNSPPSQRDSTRPVAGSRFGYRSSSRSSSRPGSRSPPPLLVTPPRTALWSESLLRDTPSESPSSPGTPPGSSGRREPVIDRLAEEFSQLGACGGTTASAWTLPRELEHTIRPLDPRRQEAADDRRSRIERQSRFFFYAILTVKERNPGSNADQLWLDLVSELIRLGIYDNEEDIRSAWHLVFREPPRPLFAYFTNGSFETTVERVNGFPLFRESPLEV